MGRASIVLVKALFLLGPALLLALAAAACDGQATTPPPAVSPTPTPATTPSATAAPTPTPPPPPTPTPTPLPTPPAEVPEDRVLVLIEQAWFAAEIADSPEARRQGLSGRESLGVHEGMWFDFDREVSAEFWMLDMRFAIDMVWVSEDLRVVHVTHEAPPPHPATPHENLPRYDSGDVPVRYVLEINAGLARQHGIRPGSHVEVVRPPGT